MQNFKGSSCNSYQQKFLQNANWSYFLQGVPNADENVNCIFCYKKLDVPFRYTSEKYDEKWRYHSFCLAYICHAENYNIDNYMR